MNREHDRNRDDGTDRTVTELLDSVALTIPELDILNKDAAHWREVERLFPGAVVEIAPLYEGAKPVTPWHETVIAPDVKVTFGTRTHVYAIAIEGKEPLSGSVCEKILRRASEIESPEGRSVYLQSVNGGWHPDFPIPDEVLSLTVHVRRGQRDQVVSIVSGLVESFGLRSDTRDSNS